MTRIVIASIIVLLGTSSSACGPKAVPPVTPVQIPDNENPVLRASGRASPSSVELFFRGEQPFARRGSEEWSLGDVTKSEMRFSPDGQRFAYWRSVGGGKKAERSASRKTPPKILVRNLAGDPVNEFVIYRPVAPEALSWIDNRRIGYLAPPDPSQGKSGAGRVFVVHDTATGEIVSA